MRAHYLLALVAGWSIVSISSSLPCLAENAKATSTPSRATEKLGHEEIAALRKEMRLLARSSDEAAFSKLGEYATDANPQIRRVAAMALGRSKNKEAYDLLLTLIHDESSDVRGSAALAMGSQRNGRAYDVLGEVIDKDGSSEVKGEAIRALGRLRTEKSTDKVLGLLKSEQADIRSSAAISLGRVADKKVIEPLIAALLDSDNKMRSTAAKSLSKLTGQEELYQKTKDKSSDEAHKAWQDWWEKNKDTFKFATRDRAPAMSAKDWIEKYDTNKDGNLDEKELQSALDEMKKGKTREEIKKGTPLKADVTMKKTDGSEVMLADLLKGTTLVYYFQSKCTHCVKAEEFIKKLYADNKGKGITFIGIAGGREKLESLNAYLSKTKFEFPVVLDEKRQFASKNQVRGTPSVLIIDKTGKIQDSYRGLPDNKKDQLTKSLAEIPKN